MSLGLPPQRVSDALSRALSKAGRALALASLLCALLVMLAFSAQYPDLLLWPGLVAPLCMGVALWWNDRASSAASSLIYLVVGSAGVYFFAWVFSTQLPEQAELSMFWFALPKVAVVVAVGTGRGLVGGLFWSLLSFLCAEVAAAGAVLQAGLAWSFDPFTAGALIASLTVSVLGGVAVVLSRRSQPRMQLAARDELLDDMRARLELRTAALMHDTLLNDLAAIANAPHPTLPAEQKAQVERDLQILLSQDWLREEAPSTVSDTLVDWRISPLHTAIQESRRLGLAVDGTGDFAAITTLDRARGTALGLAAKQCLVNVIRHSGVMSAEVAVYGSDTAVSVMVIDAGRGFEQDEVGADRLGLRTSVRRRIEAVGGSVQVWSTPGSGTSILLQLPTGEAAPEPRSERSAFFGPGVDAEADSIDDDTSPRREAS